MAALSDFIAQRLESWPPGRFLSINAVLAGFVLVAHVGALLVATAQQHPELAAIRQDSLLSVPLAAAVLVSALLAWLRPAFAARVLRLHAFALIALSVYLAAWAVQLLLARQVPQSTMWVVGYLTAIVFYSVALFVRYGISGPLPRTGLRHSGPLVALFAAGALDVCVLVKVLQ